MKRMVANDYTVHYAGNSALVSSGQCAIGAVFYVRDFSIGRKCIFGNNIIMDFV